MNEAFLSAYLDALQGKVGLVDIKGLGRELVPLLLEHLLPLEDL
jgi:hypothetical protein